jgi:hypothetical protein
MSLMGDALVELERLKQCLDDFREQMVFAEGRYHLEPRERLEMSAGLHEAKAHCRKIIKELTSINSLLRGSESKNPEAPSPEPPPKFTKPTLIKG